jgi:nucleoside-diphosphate-sugar epimerase
MSNHRVLLTGATGALGTVVRAAGWAGSVIVATSRGGGDGTIACDLTDRGAVMALVSRARPDVVVHLAAVGVTAPRPSARVLSDVNVAMLTSLCAAMDEVDEGNDVPHIALVAAGSDLADTEIGEDADPYGAAKRQVELAMGAIGRRSRRRMTSVRFGVYIGPNAPVTGFVGVALAAALAGVPLAVATPDRERRWLATSDAAAALHVVVARVLAGQHVPLGTSVPAWRASVGAVADGLAAAAATGERPTLGAMLDDEGWPAPSWTPSMDLPATLAHTVGVVERQQGAA